MRINELNMFQNLLSKAGDTASNIYKSFKGPEAGPNQEKVDKMARDMFINKFVSRGAEALSTAVQQKLVDPNSTDMGGSGGAAQPTQQPQGGAAPGGAAGGAAPGAAGGAAPGSQAPGAAAAGAPSAPAASPATAASPAGSPNVKSKAPGDSAIPTGQKQGAAKPGIDVNVDKIVSGMRSLQPAGTKPVPPESKIAKEIMADLPKVSLNKDYLIRVGDKILKLNNAGYDVKNLHSQFMGQYAKGNKQKTIQESIAESRLEEIAFKLRSSERMQNALKKAGYDPELAIRRMEDLLSKRKKAAAQRDHLVDLDEVSPQGGGRVAGAGLSQTPNAIRKREARAKAKAGQSNLQSPPGVNPATGKPFAPKPGAAPAGQAAPKPGAAPAGQAAPKAAPGQQQAKPKAAPAGQTAPKAAAPSAAAPAGQQSAANPGKPSMGAWLKDNFIKGFFRGVDWQSAEPQIDDILKRLPAAFAKGNVKKELTDIASIGWSLSPKRDE